MRVEGQIPEKVAIGHHGLRDPLFSTDVRLDPGRATVAVRGELDLCTVTLLLDCFDTLARDAEVVLDFAGLDFVDSAGLHAIAAAAREHTAHGGSLGIRSPRPTVRRMLDFADFASIDRIPA